MRNLFLCLLVLIATLALPVASANAGQSLSGTTLLEGCQAAERVDNRQSTTEDFGLSMHVFGYIIGATNAFDFTLNAPLDGTGSSHTAWCVPADATAWQIYKAVCSYLKAHPEELHYEASGEVGMALRTSFPCPKK